MLASLLAALFGVRKSSDLPVGWHWRPPRRDLTWRGWLSERLVDDPRREVHGWRAALAVRSGIDRVYRAAEARVRDLIEACPERRDLIHGDLLHANVLVAEDAGRPNAVFSWKRSLRGDFLFDTAWCTFCSAIWYPGIAAAGRGTASAGNPRCEMTPAPGSMLLSGTTATSCTSGSRPWPGTSGRAIPKRYSRSPPSWPWSTSEDRSKLIHSPLIRMISEQAGLTRRRSAPRRSTAP